MSRLTQEILDVDEEAGVYGDCWRTAIACLLDLPTPGHVPHFVAEHAELHGFDGAGTHWWDATVAFVERTRPGWTLSLVEPTFPTYADPETSPRLVIASGPSPRGDWAHAVLVDAITGDLVWDPHPSRAGLAGPPVDLACLITTGGA